MLAGSKLRAKFLLGRCLRHRCQLFSNHLREEDLLAKAATRVTIRQIVMTHAALTDGILLSNCLGISADSNIPTAAASAHRSATNT